MGRTDTNRQWTTYRILDATIDNPDLADPLNLGESGTGKGFILWGDTSLAKIEWDETSDRLLTTSATIRMGTTDKLEFRDANHYIQSDAANDLMVNAGTNLMLGIGGTDEVTLTATALTLATNNLTLTAGHISVTQGAFIYFDGQGGSEYIYSNSVGKLYINASAGGFDDITMFGGVSHQGNIRMQTTSKVEFNAATAYIHSNEAAHLKIYAGAAAGHYDAITLEAVTGAGVTIKPHLHINPGVDAKLYFWDTGVYIHSEGDARMDFVSDGAGANDFTFWGTVTMTDNVTMASGKYVYLRGTTAYIVSDASTDLMVNAPTNLMLAIGGTDEVHLTASALSPATSGGNALGTSSLLWADLFLEGGAVINFAADVTLTHSTGALRLNSTTKLEFNDAGVYIESYTDGRIRVIADGASSAAITLQATQAGDGTSGIYLLGHLRIYETDVDGTIDSQLWHASTAGRLKFYDSGVKTIPIDTDCILAATGGTIATTNRLYFNDANSSIYADAAGRIRLVATGASTAAITLDTSDAAGGICLLGHLRLYQTDVDGGTESQIWYDDSEDRIKLYTTGVQTIPIDTDCILAATGGTIATTNRLNFNSANSYIYSHAADRLRIVATAATSDAITLDTSDAAGGICLFGHLRLYQTDVDGGTESQIWYDDSEDRIKLYTTGVQTIPIDTDCILAATGGTIATTNRLNFNSANSCIYSHAANRIRIVATANTYDAITLDPSDVVGGIYCLGFLRVYETDVDGTLGGQFWYDSSEKKLKFHNGTAVETVNSST